MSTLVFGGTGFIGEFVLEELTEAVSIDASTPRGIVEKHLKNATYILWLIPPVEGLLKSFTGELQSADRLKRFLFASSLLLYGDSDRPQVESASLAPKTPYERAKKDEEELLRGIFSATPEKLLIARIGSVYGGPKSAGVIGKILSSLKSGNSFTINGDGSQIRDYIYVEDVVRTLSSLMKEARAHGIYNISTGKGHSLNEVIAKIERIAKRKVSVIHGAREEEKYAIVGDNAKIVHLIKNLEFESLDAGLEKAYTRYQ